jgi:prepilin-type N-terminal cleavage/methylation domain-containing protein
MRIQGFTLLELAIVLTVCLILLTVALPKTRDAGAIAGVAQTQSDLKILQTAIMDYYADQHLYPPDHDPDKILAPGLFALTTPFPYLTTLPLDPFKMAEGSPFFTYDYEGNSGCASFLPITLDPAECVRAYLAFGIGPDLRDSTALNDEFPFGTQMTSYSPTNGSESNGDIYALIGDYERGRFTLNGRLVGTGDGPPFKESQSH